MKELHFKCQMEYSFTRGNCERGQPQDKAILRKESKLWTANDTRAKGEKSSSEADEKTAGLRGLSARERYAHVAGIAKHVRYMRRALDYGCKM